MGFVTFDLETTGKDVRVDKICEICIYKVDDNNKVIDKYHKYINPELPVELEAEQVHGLSNKFLLNYLPFRNHVREICQFIGDYNVNGYNILRFDIPLLQKEIDESDYDFILTDNRLVIDSYNIYKRDTVRDLNSASLFYTGKPVNKAHTANGDVEATVNICLAQMEEHKDKTLEELSLYSNYDKPIFDLNDRFHKNEDDEICYSFGKYKNKSIHDVEKIDPKYTDWVLSLKEFPNSSKVILKRCR